MTGAFTETEARFQAAVMDLARWRKWRVWHDHDSRRNAAGLPDLLLVRGDRLIFAELKSRRGRVRPAQREWLAALGQTAAEVRVWRPTDWDEIVRVLS